MPGTDAIHSALTGANIHVCYRFSYANAAARLAEAGALPADVGSLALQQDNDSLWVLTDDSPLTWVTVLGTAAAHEVDAKTDYTAGDLDTEAEIISAFNTTNGKINSIIAKLEALGLLASP